MIKNIMIGGYKIEVEFSISELPHFCSGVWVYDFRVSVYQKGGRLYDKEHIEDILPCSSSEFGEIVMGMTQDMIEDRFNNDHRYDNYRSVLFAANHYDDQDSYYAKFYGMTQKELWDHMPNARRHLVHSQAYEGGEVHIFSVEIQAEIDDWDDGVEYYYFEDKVGYRTIAKEIEDRLPTEEDEELEEEELIDSILEEII